jgi:hypothetical protein
MDKPVASVNSFAALGAPSLRKGSVVGEQVVQWCVNEVSTYQNSGRYNLKREIVQMVENKILDSAV